ncbi:hypothetical protein MMC10_003368 [Thelotrema lepadinum]|nr:hypothetical protein [Thelotrema lepadinum]
MALTTLPTELLLHISSYLPNKTLEILAQTFNRRITYLCLHEISQWLKTQRNTRRMTSTFADPRRACFYGVPGAVISLWRTFKLNSEYGPCTASPNRHHSDLNEIPHFLPPIEQFSFEHGPLPFSCRQFRPINIDKLQTQAARLGLQIPESFLQLLREISAHADLSTNEPERTNQFYVDDNPLLKVSYTKRRNGSSQTVDWGTICESQHPRTADASDDAERVEKRRDSMQVPRLNLKPTLAPIHTQPKEVSNRKVSVTGIEDNANVIHVEGYLLPFYTDIHGSYNWSLFLDNGRSGPADMQFGNPGHCVVGTGGLVVPPEDSETYEDVKKEIITKIETEAQTGLDLDVDMDTDAGTDTDSYLDSDWESESESSSSCSSPATPVSAFRELPLPADKFSQEKPTYISLPSPKPTSQSSSYRGILTPLERSLGIRPLEQTINGGAFMLVDTSFDQWFSKTYYNALAWTTYEEERKEIDPNLKAWLGAVYGSKEVQG